MKISSEKLETLSQPNKHTHKHTHLKRKKKNLLVLIFNHFLNWGKKNTIMKVNTPVHARNWENPVASSFSPEEKEVGKECKRKKKTLGEICNAVILIFYYLLSSFAVQRESPRDTEVLLLRHFVHSLRLLKEKSNQLKIPEGNCQWLESILFILTLDSFPLFSTNTDCLLVNNKQPHLFVIWIWMVSGLVWVVLLSWCVVCCNANEWKWIAYGNTTLWT